MEHTDRIVCIVACQTARMAYVTTSTVLVFVHMEKMDLLTAMKVSNKLKIFQDKYSLYTFIIVDYLESNYVLCFNRLLIVFIKHRSPFKTLFNCPITSGKLQSESNFCFSFQILYIIPDKY